ncbi:lipopolysaccharide biosynthesis protein [Ferruginibacter sp.]
MAAIINLVKTATKNPAYKSVATYIFTNFFSKGISLLLVPVFTDPRFLKPEDNGILSLFSSNLMLMGPFVSLGMIQSAGADFFKKSKEEFSRSFTSNFIISFLLTLIGTAVLFLFREPLQQRFQLPPSFVYIIPFLAFLIFASEQLFALVRNRNEVNRFRNFGIGKALIEYSVSVVLIVFFLKGWEGRVWGIAISLIVSNLVGFFYYAKNGYLQFSLTVQHIIDEIKFGIPVITFQLCVFMLGTTNKLFLAYFKVDTRELGIYAIACVFGTLVGYLGQSIFLYVQPKVYKSISDGSATIESLKREFFHYFKMLIAVGVPCILFVLFLYYYVINKIYLPGIHLFLLVSLSSFIWQLNNYFFLFLLYYKAKKKIFTVAAISVVVSVIVNTLMVKNFMILGDALASLINTCIFTLLVCLFIRKLVAEKFKKKIPAAVTT